jgi:cysteine desulfurase
MLYLAGRLQPLIVGGGQEEGYRPGTENVPSIAAFAEAARRRTEALDENRERVAGLKQCVLATISSMDHVHPLPESLYGDAELYSPYILTFSASPVPGEVAVRVLNDRGFAVSTGSACSSNTRKKRGRVLTSLGIPEEDAFGAVRISFGWSTGMEDVEALCTTLERELPVLLETVR